jgi:glycosyltransferase involved in cell wall biosynthesis
MTDFISVIIPTFNPDAFKLQQTLAGLQNQVLDTAGWELILVDNNSTPPVDVNLAWHPNQKIVSAPNPGLTNARLKGIEHSTGHIIVMVDDDNILNPNYLTEAKKIFETHKQIGAAGGKSLPIFEAAPPYWLKEFYGNLALRDLGEKEQVGSWAHEYPPYAPIGAGMVIRKESLESYLQKEHTISDRIGNSLTSGGDNDIIIEILKSGWQVGYFPSLSLRHIIPAERMQVKYVAKLVNNTNRSWVQLLQSHQINPWSKIANWTAPFRKTKAWFTYRAWKNNACYIKWRGACGMFDGLGDKKAANAV